MRYNGKNLGIYIHIPFCLSKCAYCDFFSFVPANNELIERYVDAIIKQMENYRSAALCHIVDTVFIGGGTPTILPTSQLARLMRAVRKTFIVSKNAEITIESNPNTVDYHKLKKLAGLGINRISFGLQSGDQKELNALSRNHTRKDFEAAYRMARSAGFKNINIDLMFGIPYQTKESLMRNLRYAVRLAPEHISFYNLKIEPGTPFSKIKDTLILPSEDDEVDFYLSAVEFLNSSGYLQYEISNFSRPDKKCLHNLKYWNCDEYLGFGPSAHSYFDNNRFSYIRDFDNYINGIEIPKSRIQMTDEFETISQRERIGEYIMLRLRLNAGISENVFKRKFGLSFSEHYGAKLKKYIDGGFMRYREGNYALTPKGMLVSNYILSDILDFKDAAKTIFSLS